MVGMVLKKVENGLEKLFDRTLSRPFKSTLQPIEIGSRLVRELDLHRRLSAHGPVSPNTVRMWLSAKDADRFEGFQKALVTELEETTRQHAIKEGYSFVGPVTVEIFVDDDVKFGDVLFKTSFTSGTSEPRLIASDGRSFIIGDNPLVIGRSPQATVVINDANVSRQHAEVWRTEQGVAVRDLGSTNGTFVNGHRIDAVSLSPRDDVSIGPLRFRIELA
jgi:Protein of unknown function (DUF3662)/FHA domain